MKLTGLYRAEKFMRRQQELGSEIRWDGWTMVHFFPHPAAFRKGGAFRNGRYGFETRIEVDSKGAWNVPPRLVLHG